MVPYLVIILIVALLGAFLLLRRARASSSDASSAGVTKGGGSATSAKRVTLPDNNYSGLRSMALSVDPAELGIPISGGETVVYGVVMDWNMGSVTATLVAYQTGDASIYLSSGGGVVGGGQHAEVSTAAKLLLSTAHGHLDKAHVVTDAPLPGADEVYFYLLTSTGMYRGSAKPQDLENGSSDWFDLFNDSNKVMTALRQTVQEEIRCFLQEEDEQKNWGRMGWDGS